MKSRFLIIFLFLNVITFIFSGCNYNGTKNDVSILIYKQNLEETGAYELNINLEKYKLILNDTPVYSFSNLNDNFYPEYWSNSRMVLNSKITPISDICEHVLSEENLKIFSNNYTLEKLRSNEWILYENDKKLKNINTLDVGAYNFPTVFFVENDNITMLSPDSDENGSILLFLLSYNLKTNNFTVEKIDTSNTELNISVPPMKDNISKNKDIIIINSEVAIYKVANTKIETILTEKEIKKNIRYLDTRRGFDGFFTSCGYQDNTYLASFPAYNELFGQYVAFYSNDMQFMGYLIIRENNISLFNNKGEKKDSIDGVFNSQIYINKQY